MAKNYGWTGRVRHGLWRCKKCEHWNYYRTHTLRIDSSCYAQGATIALASCWTEKTAEGAALVKWSSENIHTTAPGDGQD